MKHRILGRTGIQVSEVGIGGHREGVEYSTGTDCSSHYHVSAQKRAEVVARAIDRGVTYFDTTWGCEIESLGQSLRLLGRRDGLFVSAMRVDFYATWLRRGSPDIRQYVRSEVEGRLAEFGIGTVDQLMLGALEGGDPLAHPRAAMDDAIDEFRKLRDEGKFRTLGFSCHSPDYAARLIETFPAFDTVMTPYNFANRAAEGRLADVLRKTGMAWVAMKPHVWHLYGLPVTALRNLRAVAGRLDFDPAAPIGRLALQFILQNPLITTCVPAVNSIAAADENADASGQGVLNAADLQTLEAYAKVMSAENFVPLGIAGLLERNTRVRGCALGLVAGRLNLKAAPVAWNQPESHRAADAAAEGLLAEVSKNPQWAPLIPSA